MSEKNFKIKHGLNLGDHELITADGNIVLPVGKTISDSDGQPVGLPTQTNNSGKYLTTNGSVPTWETITQYTPPIDQGAGNFLAGDGTYKSLSATTTRASFTATAGQTSFPVAYTVGQIDVFLNGIKLTQNVDFTATNGTSVEMIDVVNAGDILDVITFGTFNVADAYTKSEVDNMLTSLVSFSSGTTAPSVAKSGDLWKDTGTGILYIAEFDGVTLSWFAV